MHLLDWMTIPHKVDKICDMTSRPMQVEQLLTGHKSKMISEVKNNNI